MNNNGDGRVAHPGRLLEGRTLVRARATLAVASFTERGVLAVSPWGPGGAGRTGLPGPATPDRQASRNASWSRWDRGDRSCHRHRGRACRRWRVRAHVACIDLAG